MAVITSGHVQLMHIIIYIAYLHFLQIKISAAVLKIFLRNAHVKKFEGARGRLRSSKGAPVPRHNGTMASPSLVCSATIHSADILKTRIFTQRIQPAWITVVDVTVVSRDRFMYSVVVFRHVGYLGHQQQVDIWPFDL